MSPYADPSPDIDQHPLTIPITGPESPSASTIVSSASINTALVLSSEITGEGISSRSSGLPVESTNTRIPQSTKQGPFTQHKRFFFEDGNITFLVDGILYRVHRYFFCRDSNMFMTRLSRLLAQEVSSLPVISIENVKSKDFDAFLSVLYPLDFNALEEHSFEESSSILDLSTRWGFTSIRELAIRCLEPPTPHERLILGKKYGVDQWIALALQELCERPQPLTPDEARLMEFEDVVLVGSVREKVRKHALTVNSAGIRDFLEAQKSGELQEQPDVVPKPPPVAVAEATKEATPSADSWFQRYR
ncbi:hypothetical protein DFH94DRAFT_690169 [Russula ochroleuca]|uniref:BTB domain-containing protein n=1 Tax=Russula ochroleuca TaxID=152965 RepID=A0A9P5N153_9AGAM|nr:hypothetical protein DFH94DRAFT_690169 [Russula ochroleuca]